ncbi:hypothetical protein [Embleya sp. NPDC059237]|uniref:hypothetical protein n=1 Tax=Embleya sp. NPDC059237 TaxID=3346784 RepID=UPI003684AC69
MEVWRQVVLSARRLRVRVFSVAVRRAWSGGRPRARVWVAVTGEENGVLRVVVAMVPPSPVNVWDS